VRLQEKNVSHGQGPEAWVKSKRIGEKERKGQKYELDSLSSPFSFIFIFILFWH
jgi:hypothetical protein